MDIVTQGLLGAALAQSAAPRQHVRGATIVGFCAGLLPDADALFRSAADPLQFLDWHRHFTHALIFIPVGALIAALLLSPLYRRSMGARRLYGFAFLGYALAGLLDACTSYGTHLWWPFTDQRVAWGLISIVDPLFSIVLLAGVAGAFWGRGNAAARGALVVGGCYLAFGLYQHQQAEAVAWSLAAQRGLAPARIVVKPTFGNLVLWRLVTVDGQEVYADGVRLAPWGSPRSFLGERSELVSEDSIRSWGQGNPVAIADFKRFERFAEGLVGASPGPSRHAG